MPENRVLVASRKYTSEVSHNLLIVQRLNHTSFATWDGTHLYLQHWRGRGRTVSMHSWSARTNNRDQYPEKIKSYKLLLEKSRRQAEKRQREKDHCQQKGRCVIKTKKKEGRRRSLFSQARVLSWVLYFAKTVSRVSSCHGSEHVHFWIFFFTQQVGMISGLGSNTGRLTRPRYLSDCLPSYTIQLVILTLES